MKCDEVMDLMGPYLDSELDARSMQKVQGHLIQCTACTRSYRAEQECEANLCKALQSSEKTVSLWNEAEALVTENFRQRERHGATALKPRHLISDLDCSWRDLLWPSPKYYLALALVWMALVVFYERMPEPGRVPARFRDQMTPETRLALRQQHRELRELLAMPELSKPESEPNPMHPRSERPEGCKTNEPA